METIMYIKKEKPVQQFKYLVVLDFEATCQEGPKQIENQEIIEFPSIILNTETLEIIDEFREYVRPVYNPQLLPFCTRLTGIQQDWVSNASLFLDVEKRHFKWLQSHELILENGDINPLKNWAFVTCGDWDFKTMIIKQFEMAKDDNGIIHSQKVRNYYSHWINVKKSFETHYRKPCKGMVSILSKLNITLEGKHHSGLDDCRNITKIVKKMLRDDCLFAFNSTSLPRNNSMLPPRQRAFQRQLRLMEQQEDKQLQQQQDQLIVNNSNNNQSSFW